MFSTDCNLARMRTPGIYSPQWCAPNADLTKTRNIICSAELRVVFIHLDSFRGSQMQLRDIINELSNRISYVSLSELSHVRISSRRAGANDVPN